MTDVTAPVTASVIPTVDEIAAMPVLPQFATTPKAGRATKRPHIEPKALMTVAVLNGGRVDLTDSAVMADLKSRGLRMDRISSAAWGAKHYFGAKLTSERTGRRVTAFVVKF